MSTEQVPNFCSEPEAPEDMRAFSKERAESCGDSAPERTWRSHEPRSPAASRRPANNIARLPPDPFQDVYKRQGVDDEHALGLRGIAAPCVVLFDEPAQILAPCLLYTSRGV